MKKNIKIISLLLCFCMLFSCAGCSSSDEQKLQRPSADYWQDIPENDEDDSVMWGDTEKPDINITVIGGDKDLTDKEQHLAEEAERNVSVQSMVYNAIQADFLSVGFSASIGFAFLKENKDNAIPGIYYYCDDVDAYADEDLSSCGFVEIISEQSPQMGTINAEDLVFVVDSSLSKAEKTYVYDYDYEGIGPYHFVYQNKYIIYNQETDGVVRYFEKDNIRENYDLSLGSLYNYDTDTYIYDESIYGDYKSHEGESLLGTTDYNKLEEELQKQIELQNEAGYNVEEYQIVYISPEAVQAYIDSEEEATFFGYNVSEITEEFGLGTALVYTEEGFKSSEIINPTQDGYNWKSFLIKCGIGCGIILVGAILSPITGGVSFSCALITISQNAITAALTAAIGTLALETVSGLIQGKSVRDSIKDATYRGLDVFANQFIIAATVASIGVLKGTIKPTACFVAGTKVLLANGIYKNIENITVGDEVLSYSEESGEYTPQRVIDTFIKKANSLVEIDMGEEKIIATLSHPFYVPEFRRWVPAGQLKEGYKLLTTNNRYAEVESVELKHCKDSVDVFNFTVENTHTYFVGDNPVLVHNSCQKLTDAEVDSARAKAGRLAKKNALEEIEGLRNPVTGKIRATDLREWASKWGLDMTNPDDVKVANFVAKNGRFPSFAAKDGFQCDFAHAVDVNKIVKAYNSGKITKEQALKFMSNPNNGILTSRQTHFLLHGGSWSGTTNYQLALKARSSIAPYVEMILQIMSAA